MKEKEDSLQPQLRDWKVEIPIPPRFQAEVWHRIEARSSNPIPSWLEEIISFFRWRGSWVILSIVILASFAWAYHITQQQQLENRYHQSINPFLLAAQ